MAFQFQKPSAYLSGAATQGLPPTYERQGRTMLQGALGTGLLAPTGSPRIRALLRRRAMMGYQNGLRRTGVLSQLYGLDPSQQRAALTNADISGHQGLTNALTEADYGELTANRPFYQNLFSGGLDFERQRQMAEEERKRQSAGGLGGLLGSAIGMAAGPIGSAIGGAFGSRSKSYFGGNWY